MPLPRSLARFNRKVTNYVTRPFARWLPGFAVVEHAGRTSGRVYRTPVNAFRVEGGVAFALTYGRADWVKNVVHAGSATLHSRGRAYRITNPRIVTDPEHRELPAFVRPILRRIGVEEELRVDRSTSSARTVARSPARNAASSRSDRDRSFIRRRS
jgi:deazaflavin-dependent oxidoreductase (nitroreductase family)